MLYYIMLFNINTGLKNEYINFINDLLLFIVFILLVYIISDINKHTDLIKILFAFIFVKHLLVNKLISIN